MQRKLPKATRYDPLHEPRQCVERYGDDIAPSPVKAILGAIKGIQRNEIGYPGDRGPVASKHYQQGHASAAKMAVGIILESLLKEGQIFTDLLDHWSLEGAKNQIVHKLRHLETALEAGIWK